LETVRLAQPLQSHLERIKTLHEIDLRQRLELEHKEVATTMIYTHVTKIPGVGVRSPLDGWSNAS
jgi:hypothetical protein